MISYTFKIAESEAEFDQIFELNYRTFVDEIPQHEKNECGKLVDKFHDENTYLVCLKDGTLYGMMALRDIRPFSLDAKIPNLDQYLPTGRKPLEIRLLSVVPEARTGQVLKGLLALLVNYNQIKNWDLGVISATTRQLKLYTHLGFVPFAYLVGSEAAPYQPMYIELEAFKKSTQKILPRAEPRSYNFLPGPVAISAEVATAFGMHPISHRCPEFRGILKSCEEKLCRLTQARHAVISLGSGTLANEMVAAQISRLGRKGVKLSNGEFGDRLIGHAERFGLEFDLVVKPWGEIFNPDQDIAPGYDWLWMVACETSTGMKNDLEEIAERCDHFNMKLCIDAVSALGAYDIDLANTYLASGSSGKSLAAYPGLAVVLYNHEVTSCGEIPVSLDIGYYSEKGKIPFTHSSNLVEAFSKALEKFEAPKERYRKLERQSSRLRSELEQCGVEFLVDSQKSSPAVFTIAVERSLDVAAELESKGIFVASQSDYLIERNWIQICLMGEITEDAIGALVRCFE
ncbi:MAG: aminotransferase class V-fold PLP-dependent enzyme [Verrucomicrobiales bacterium]|nr:aminotransferase class V-fold PLP-dependent enzyme [Verrucomicrobiales bacterium]